MNISPISSQNTATKKGSKIGTMAGLGASGAYVATQAKDLFTKLSNESVKNYGTKNKGILFASVVSGGVIAAGTLAGKLVGTAIGKIVDTVKQNKDQIADVLSQNVEKLNEIKPTSVSELEKFLETEE